LGYLQFGQCLNILNLNFRHIRIFSKYDNVNKPFNCWFLLEEYHEQGKLHLRSLPKTDPYNSPETDTTV